MASTTASFLSPAARLFCAAAALVTTCALAAILLAGWQHQAEPVWLAATPEVLAEVAACDSERDRLQRVRCKQGLVAARASSDTRPYPVASR